MEQTYVGQDLFGVFVKDRIQTGTVNIWEPMKKRKLLTCKTGKEISIAGPTQTVELRGDRNLFARMLLVCKSRPQIDVKEAVGTYEFTVVSRSMCAVDGSMLHCSLESALMHIFEKLRANPSLTAKVAIVPNQELSIHKPIVCQTRADYPRAFCPQPRADYPRVYSHQSSADHPLVNESVYYR